MIAILALQTERNSPTCRSVIRAQQFPIPAAKPCGAAMELIVALVRREFHNSAVQSEPSSGDAIGVSPHRSTEVRIQSRVLVLLNRIKRKVDRTEHTLFVGRLEATDRGTVGQQTQSHLAIVKFALFDLHTSLACYGRDFHLTIGT